MYLNPTALVLADRGQRTLIESVRFDAPVGEDRRRAGRTRRLRLRRPTD